MPRLTTVARDALVEERKQQILAAAVQVFSEKGFDGATIRDIAAAAGIAEGSIYNYFKNKYDLLVHIPRQLAQPALDAFSMASTQAATNEHPPEELLTFVASNMLNIVSQNREILRVLLTSLPIMDDQLRAEYIDQVPVYAMELLERYVADQQAAGNFRVELDPAITARAFPGMLLFFAFIQELLQPPALPRLDYEKIISSVISIYMHGVLTAK